jgi:hypothetical protein
MLSRSSFSLRHATSRLLLPLLAALCLAPASASADVDTRIDFQPDSSMVASGYTKDTGQAFDEARGFGWVRADSIASAPHAPLDLTLNTRERSMVRDRRQATFIHMQYPVNSTTPGTSVPGAWELAVPDGTYVVTVGVGDGLYTDSVHHINAEGQTLQPDFAPITSKLFAITSGQVHVSDGRLTLDPTGGTNTKLDFVTVKTVDSVAPAAPTGLTATAGDHVVSLSWTASPESDLASYSVYRSTGTTVDVSGAALASGLTTPSFADTTAVNGTAYTYAVVAKDSSGNASGASATASATPAVSSTTTPFDIEVNFQAQTTATPAGYQGDDGEAYDAARGYGWVDASTGAPLSLVGNGRERNVNADKRLDTFVSMQLPKNSPGVQTPGSWKAAVPNGSYRVTVAVGDPTYLDSYDLLHVNGITAIDFHPTTTTALSQTNTITVAVTDGTLLIDASGGTNTKIDYVRIQTVNPSAPHVTAVTPGDGATGVCRDGAVTLQLSMGVDPTTATADGLRLLGPDGTQIGGHYNTDGGHSNVTVMPAITLAATTTYTIKATSELEDPDGDAYAPFTSTFTTGATTCATQADVSFASTQFDYSDGTSATNTTYKTGAPTALALGPDPSHPTQLWAAFGSGNILVYNLDPATGLAAGAPTQVPAFKLQRMVSSLAFDPTSTGSHIKLWVSNGQFGCDLAAVGIACDDFTGSVSTLTGTDSTTVVRTDVVTGLPRSVGNHMNNGIAFGPDGALYLAQGAENGYGAPDDIWGNRAEDPLSAAVLRIDVAGITSPPYSVNTSTGYDPSAANAKVTTYVTGIRNPFSLTWASNGNLYAPVNESANGNTPADSAGGAPALTDLPAMDDYFTRVVPGRYYGHPNPARGEYRLNGGNPTSGMDPFEVPQYPVGTQPNGNWRQPDLNLGLHRSGDGSAEYTSSVLGDKLQGQILVTEYSQGKDIIAIKLDANGKAVSKAVVASGFYNPLPIVTDKASGRIYVGEYGSDPMGVGGKLTLLTPQPPAVPGAIRHVNFQAQASTTPSGYVGDYGLEFNSSRGYGWEDNATGTPLSIVGNGRERNAIADKRLDTLMQMQAGPKSGNPTPARWDLTLPDGTYDVTVGVGDPSYTDSHDVINAEGQKIIDFTPTAAQKQATFTSTVTVTDGSLTLTPTNGTNTKIDFVDVADHVVGGVRALSVSSPEDNLGLGNRMIFSTVKDQARAGHNLTLTNTGTAVVTVTGATFGGANGVDFQLCGGQASTFTIAAGASATLCVQYRPTVSAVAHGLQTSQGTLTLSTDEPSGSPHVVTLGGIDTVAYEGDNEPNLQQVVNVLGYNDNVGVTNKPFNLSIGPDSTPIGDEIRAPYFTALDSSRPVALIPVSRYGAKIAGADSQQFGWYAKGSATNTFLYALPGGTSSGGANDGYGQNQLLMPKPSTGVTTFTPSGAFGLVDGSGWHTDDALNSGAFHNLRIYPAKNAGGTSIPGTFIVSEDIYSPVNMGVSKNWDYQDFTFILTNATPDPTASQPAAGEVSKTLASFPGDAGGVGNSGFTSTQGAVNTSRLSYSGGQLRIATTRGTDATATNALQIGVNSGTAFRVQGRLVGPFANDSDRQQGIFWGPSATNQLEARVTATGGFSGARSLVVAMVSGGTRTVLRTIRLTAGTTSVDFRITVTPSPAGNGNPFATVSYALSGSSTFTNLTSGNVTIPGSWITANTPAGITAYHTSGGSSFSARFADFSVARSY